MDSEENSKDIISLLSHHKIILFRNSTKTAKPINNSCKTWNALGTSERHQPWSQTYTKAEIPQHQMVWLQLPPLGSQQIECFLTSSEIFLSSTSISH